MRRARLPKAQPKILDGGRRLSQPKKLTSTPESNECKSEQILADIPKSIDKEVENETGPPPSSPSTETPSPEVEIEEHVNVVIESVDVPVPDVEDDPNNPKIPETYAIPEVSVSKEVSLSEPSAQEKVKEKRQYRKRNQPPPAPDKMRLMDYIFFNPTSNPMPKPAEKSEEEVASVVEPTEEEEMVDNPDNQVTDVVEKPSEDILPGPRVMIGPDGQITIDESSLVIQRTQTEEDISQKEVVYETSDTTYKSFRRKGKFRNVWSDKETAKFYKVLSIVGTDFTLMEKMFPDKSRIDLKNKYKKEERVNHPLVDKALSEWQEFDIQDLDEYLEDPDPPASSEVTKENKSTTRGSGRKRGGGVERVRGGKRGRPRKIVTEEDNTEKTKIRRKPKRHHNPIWDDSGDETPCEQCAIKTQTTKRQKALADKGIIRTCKHHQQGIDELAENESETSRKTTGSPQVVNTVYILGTTPVRMGMPDEASTLSNQDATDQLGSKTPSSSRKPSSLRPILPCPIVTDPTLVPPILGTPIGNVGTPLTLSSTAGFPSAASAVHGVPAGKFVVVASKPENSDQQVLHLYLVSPPNKGPSTSADSSSPLKALLAAPLKSTPVVKKVVLPTASSPVATNFPVVCEQLPLKSTPVIKTIESPATPTNFPVVCERLPLKSTPVIKTIVSPATPTNSPVVCERLPLKSTPMVKAIVRAAPTPVVCKRLPLKTTPVLKTVVRAATSSPENSPVVCELLPQLPSTLAAAPKSSGPTIITLSSARQEKVVVQPNEISRTSGELQEAISASEILVSLFSSKPGVQVRTSNT